MHGWVATRPVDNATLPRIEQDFGTGHDVGKKDGFLRRMASHIRKGGLARTHASSSGSKVEVMIVLPAGALCR